MVGIKAHGKGLMLSILRNGNEVRDAEPYFARLTTKKPDTQAIALARELIERMSGCFEPEKWRMNMPAQFASS
jgi:non-homologous end joining protein Ku